MALNFPPTPSNPIPKYDSGARIGLVISLLAVATSAYTLYKGYERQAKLAKANHELLLYVDSCLANQERILDSFNRRLDPPGNPRIIRHGRP